MNTGESMCIDLAICPSPLRWNKIEIYFSMNEIRKSPLENMGSGFIRNPGQFDFEDEYHFRNIQNPPSDEYRPLTANEIEILVRNQNTSDDWNNIRVSSIFNPNLIRHCEFYGMVRLGNFDNCTLEYHDLRLPVGLYHSMIVNCDIGNDVISYLDQCRWTINSRPIHSTIDPGHQIRHHRFLGSSA